MNKHTVNDALRDEVRKIMEERDALLAACKAAYAKMTGDGWDGTLGHHPDNPVPQMLRAAIAKAEGEER